MMINNRSNCARLFTIW